MPKVVKSRRRPPEGWDEVSETIAEFEQKMREGTDHIFVHIFINLMLYLKRKMNHMRVKEKRNQFGRYLEFTINKADIFMIYFIEDMQYLKNCTNIC